MLFKIKLGVMSQPQPRIRLSPEKSVLAVELFDLRANSKMGTYHREGSRCTFTDEIAHAQFRITLRLDWGDMNNGEPTLDIDVGRIREDGTLKNLSPKKIPSHHTPLSALVPGSTEPRFYDIEFEGLSLRLVARKTFATSVSLSAYIVGPEAQPPN